MVLRYKDKINISLIVSFFGMVILFITSWAPFMTTSTLGNDSLRKVLNYLVWIIIGVSIAIVPKRTYLSMFDLIAIVSVLVYRAYNVFYAFDYKGLGLSSLVFSLFFCCLSDEIRKNIFLMFKHIMVFISAIGIILYISYILQLGIPYTIVKRIDGMEWIDYKICYLMKQSSTMIRFNGTFEEPGWFGTWAAFFLCADDINLKKRGNILLLISGTLTMSIAFFLILLLYYFFKNLDDWKRWTWLVLLGLFYLFVIPNIKTGNSNIDSVIERMTIKDGSLAGDNRSGPLFAKVWDDTLRSGKMVFGQGAEYAEFYGTGEGEGLATIKSYLVNFGIVGTTIIFLPLLVVAIIKATRLNNNVMLRYIIISYISLYQRPYLFWTPYLAIFLCGIAYTKINKTEGDRRNSKYGKNNQYITHTSHMGISY